MERNEDERTNPFLIDEDNDDGTVRHSHEQLPVSDGEALQAFEL